MPMRLWKLRMMTWAWICLSCVMDLHVFRSSMHVLVSSVSFGEQLMRVEKLVSLLIERLEINLIEHIIGV